MAYNGFGLCVRAGFGAQNCQTALNLNRSTKLQVCTSPRLTQNPCYMPLFFSFRQFCHTYVYSFRIFSVNVCNNFVVINCGLSCSWNTVQICKKQTVFAYFNFSFINVSNSTNTCQRKFKSAVLVNCQVNPT